VPEATRQGVSQQGALLTAVPLLLILLAATALALGHGPHAGPDIPGRPAAPGGPLAEAAVHQSHIHARQAVDRWNSTRVEFNAR